MNAGTHSDFVMAGLVPAIHVFLCGGGEKQDVDGRDEPGHDVNYYNDL